MDIFDPKRRSEIMASIRSKNTKPELIVFRYLRGRKIYFQKHYKRAPGSPDVALPRKKKAVFIHGDFWHGKTIANLTERRGADDFWTIKITKNMQRDELQMKILSQAGWTVLIVWESELRKKSTREACLVKVEEFLLSP